MERNHIIGFVLIFALLMVWTFVNAPSKEEKQRIALTQDSLHRAELIKDSIQTKAVDSVKTVSAADSVQLANKYGSFASAVTETGETVHLENALFKVDFSSKGGKISGVELKKYSKVLLDDKKQEYKIPVRLLEDPRDIWDIAIPTQRGDLHTSDLNFQPSIENNKITFTALGQQGERIIQEYTLTDSPYEIKYRFAIENGMSLIANSGQTAKLTWINQLNKLERNSTFERSYSTVYYKVNTASVDYCSCRKNDVNNLAEQPIKWISHSNQFFNSALIADESFHGGVFSTTMLPDSSGHLKVTSSVVGIPFNGSNPSSSMTMYVGPNDFEQLRHYHVNLEDLIPFGRSIFGTINRWVIRPMFNFLLSFISSKGIVILLLTLLVKLALFPLSYKMLGSQAKMTALKPKLAHLKEKHKEDMQQQQVESMKIYREYGVNPLGGCFPVVMQMPVWFALYRFFPASIEFRQAKFLWATDLSSFDVFTYLPFNIPFYGDHVSLLTLLWAVSTIVYTYYNMQNVDMANQNPALKYMQYLMPVMFLVFFNSYASGLTLYLLYSNTLNIIQTVGARRYLFDTDKIMEKLNVNKAKPKKEGGFQSRIEAAMNEQKRLTEAKNNKLKKKN
ncbi:MAG: membrane protein insertase YidC [Saprospiraceae bacterium]